MVVRWFDQTTQTERIRIAGKDRVKSLHNLTTADVKHLGTGQGVEAFVTSLQGKSLAHVRLLAGEAEIYMLGDSGTWAGISDHVAKFAVFDETSWQDATSSTKQIHIHGHSSLDLIEQSGLLPVPHAMLAHQEMPTPRGVVQVVREAPFGGAGLTCFGPAAAIDSVIEQCKASLMGFEPYGEQDAEALRIAAGTPRLGQEVTPDRLPQELGRDKWAISFTKGCYLGQETIARIDALGHVNRVLRGLSFDGPPPHPGARLADETGKDVGWITSVASHPKLGSIGLGFLKTPQINPGARLLVQVDQQVAGHASVSALPLD